MPCSVARQKLPRDVLLLLSMCVCVCVRICDHILMTSFNAVYTWLFFFFSSLSLNWLHSYAWSSIHLMPTTIWHRHRQTSCWKIFLVVVVFLWQHIMEFILFEFGKIAGAKMRKSCNNSFEYDIFLAWYLSINYVSLVDAFFPLLAHKLILLKWFWIETE